MRVHDDWNSAGFDLPPVSPHVGPFPRRAFLRLWHSHREPGTPVEIVESHDALIPLCRRNGRVEFAGDADLTDYHSPLGGSSEHALAEWAGAQPAGTSIAFDSLPEEAAAALARGLRSAGHEPDVVRHDIAAVVTVPPTFDEWLAGLARKHRHETRRKLRRFESEAGAPSLVRLRDGADRFASMHRLAGGRKGRFMTPEMERFFADLVAECGAVVDVLTGRDGTELAAAFGFESSDAYYLYNSAYAPDAARLSPGIVLVAALVRSAVRSGRRRLDFLKGDERYKFDLGAEPRPLYRVTAVLGG